MKKILNTAVSLSVLSGMVAVGPGQARAEPNDHHQDQHQDHRDVHPVQQHQHHRWHRGGQIDHQYWDHASRVDYHDHHLRPPPPGYEWRQVGNNFILAAVATGIIASIIAAGH